MSSGKLIENKNSEINNSDVNVGNEEDVLEEIQVNPLKEQSQENIIREYDEKRPKRVYVTN